MIQAGNMKAMLVATTLLVGFSGAASAQDGGGYFTQDQADKGAALFDANCSACHGKNLEGVEAPGLAGPDVMGNWDTAEGIYAYFSVAMPPTAPGKLGEEAYVNILAHILAVNGAPAGTKALTGDKATLDAINLVAATTVSAAPAATAPAAPATTTPAAPAAGAAPAAPTVPQAFTAGKTLPTVGGPAADTAAPAAPPQPTVPQAFTFGKDLPTVTK